MAFNVGDVVIIYTKKSFFSTPYSFDIVKEISGGGISLISSSTVFNSDGSSEYAQLLTLEEGKVKIERTKKCSELNNKIKQCSINNDKFLNYDDNTINTITTSVDIFYNYINNL